MTIMERTMLKSKIHRATITEANLNYEGSFTIDLDILEEAGILPYEKVAVVNINNGFGAGRMASIINHMR